MTPKTTGNKPLSRSLRIYQKIAIAFVIISFILLLFVLYLSISSATINIKPVPQIVNTTVSVDVVPDAAMEGQVSGYVVSQTFTQADVYYLPEQGSTPVEEKAGGIVSLINETSNNQQLIATTRLLSKDGVLFRLDEGTVVPANGQIDVMVHADEPGLLGEIGPTQFTIPGLAESLQDKIYAVSIGSMAGGVSYVRTLQESDFDDAASSLTQKMLESAKEIFASQIDTDVFDGSQYLFEVVERVADQEPGVQVGSFTVSLTAKITAVFYDQSVIEDYAEADLQSQISENYNIDSVSKDGVQVEIRSADGEAQTATLNVYIDGTAILSPSSDVLDKDRLVGRSPSEVITILEASELIDNVSVNFTPFWLKRIPTLKDHIKIIIK
ncbi:hypothetical protein KJ673_02540 [Patescibacteria group bacterium]|nr:hypothetical protein [Patescibacteria group bacterium]MBU4453334.1 hypothetical protein [Patescibacteria group bacterium]MCG2687748.1 hypothetical protein [Candidatus Parcubacteria bacterium]